MKHLHVLPVLLLVACASAGYTRQAQPPVEAKNWIVAPHMRFVAQKNETDCGWAVLDALKQRWAVERTLAHGGSSKSAQQGAATSLTAGQLKRLLEDAGLRAFVVAGTWEDLVLELRAGRPVVVGTYRVKDDVALGHYQVVAGVSRSGDQLLLMDPARGWHTQGFAAFDKLWSLSKRVAIVAMPAVLSSY